MKIHDVTLSLTEPMPVYPNERGLTLTALHRVEWGDTASGSYVEFGTHTGTHVDAPYHFYAAGTTVDQLPLEVLIGPATVIECQGDAVTVADLEGAALPAGTSRLLFKTRNSPLLHQAEFDPTFVYIDPAAAHWLVDHDVRLVGLDYISIEQYGSATPAAHLALLGANVIVIEGLDLTAITPGAYQLICLPLRLAAEGCPARVVLIEE